MTEKEYRAHPAVSRSELWRIHESPQKFKYLADHHGEPTPALLFGQVFHKLALEPDTFCDEFFVMPDIDRRTKAGKESWQKAVEESQSKTVVPQDIFEQIQAMCSALMAESLAQKLLDGAREQPFFWVDELTGEQCKCRTDVLNLNYSQPIVVDLKSTTDASTDAFIRDAIKFGYDFQAAMYSEGVEKNIGRRPLFVFIAVEKEPPYGVNILQADELFLRRGWNLYREFLGIYHECKITGNWWGYLGKHTQINNLSLPAWLARDL